MSFTKDGGNYITTVQVNAQLVDLDRKENKDNFFIYRWIKNNIDKNARLVARDDTMCSIYFSYNDILLGMTVTNYGSSTFNLLSPVEGIENFYTHIREKLDSATIMQNNKRK